MGLLQILNDYIRRREALLRDAEIRLQAAMRMTDPWDGQSVEDFAQSAAQLSTAVQRRAVILSSTVQRRQMRDLGIDVQDFVPIVPNEVRLFNPDFHYEYAKPIQVKVDGGTSERLSSTEIFNRPARLYRKMITEGKDEGKALAKSVERARIELGTNVSLAERDVERQFMRQAAVVDLDVIGWRRVIHPELAKTGTCGLCIAASDRIYKVEDLKPLHTDCNCTVSPVKSGSNGDPGGDLNQLDLSQIYTDAGGTSAGHLLKTKYKVDEHGELQSVLVPANKGEVVPRARSLDAPVELDYNGRQLDTAQRQLPQMRRLLAQTLAKGFAEDSAPVKWQRAQVKRFEDLLSSTPA